MIYAVFVDNDLIVGAADTFADFEAFFDKAVAHAEGYVNVSKPSTMEMFTDDRFSKYRVVPYLFEFASVSDRDNFVELYNIEIKTKNGLLDKHNKMLNDLEQDPYKAPPPGEAVMDNRTIAEKHNLKKFDRWANAIDENEKAMKPPERKDIITEDYFPVITEEMLLDEIRGEITRKTTGDILVRVDRVIARKDGDDDEEPRSRDPEDYIYAIEDSSSPKLASIVQESYWNKYRKMDNNILSATLSGILPLGFSEIGAGIFEIDASITDPDTTLTDLGFRFSNNLLMAIRGESDPDADDNSTTIADDGLIAVYFKLSIVGKKIADIKAIIETDAEYGKDRSILARNNTAGCWFVYLRKLYGEQLAEILSAKGIDAEVYGVNEQGERLVPKGSAEVVDINEVVPEPPTPWNGDVKIWKKMNKKAREANKKKYHGRDFIFCGGYEGPGKGCIIFITPSSWFKEKGTLYPEPLDIAHILPHYLNEISPGVYQTKQMDWSGLLQELCVVRGFRENILFQMYINSL